MLNAGKPVGTVAIEAIRRELLPIRDRILAALGGGVE